VAWYHNPQTKVLESWPWTRVWHLKGGLILCQLCPRLWVLLWQHRSLMGNRLHETEGREDLTPSGTELEKPQMRCGFIKESAGASMLPVK